MTLTVDINPELQAELARQAADQGVGVEAYAAWLLEVAAHASEGLRRSAQQMEVTLQEMARFAQKIPSLPDDAFSRESLYRNHD